MKITIDTKEDSKEEIKKLISFLEKLMDPYHSYDSEPKNSEPFNMFAEDSENKESISSGMDMFSSDSNKNIFADESSDIYSEKKKEETFNVRDMLEKY